MAKSKQEIGLEDFVNLQNVRKYIELREQQEILTAAIKEINKSLDDFGEKILKDFTVAQLKIINVDGKSVTVSGETKYNILGGKNPENKNRLIQTLLDLGLLTPDKVEIYDRYYECHGLTLEAAIKRLPDDVRLRLVNDKVMSTYIKPTIKIGKK